MSFLINPVFEVPKQKNKETFESELMAGHKGAAVEIPFDPAKKWSINAKLLWPGRRGHTVQGELNGVRFGSCVVARSRKFWMLVSDDVQKKAGVSAGDMVRFSVEPFGDIVRPRKDLNRSKSQKQKRPSKKHVGATFDVVRGLALALPGVEEATSYRTHTFRIRGRMLARFHQDGESLVLKVDYTAREVLTGSQPEMFYVTDHYRCWPLMLVRLKNVDVDLLRDLIEEAWRGIAPKKAIVEYEAKRSQ